MIKTLKFTSLLLIFILSLVSVSAQDAKPNAVITLSRTPCFGKCPAYSIEIFEDGTVIYKGLDSVTVIGEQTYEIAPETVALMVEAFEKVGYFEWDEAYNNMTITDQPTVVTSVTRDGKTHSIVRYAGDNTAPLALPFLERWVDEMASTAMWTGAETELAWIANAGVSPILTMQRTACFGACPVYSLSAFEDGTIVYLGNANVDNIGVYVFQADPLAISNVAQLAEIFGYAKWEDSYENMMMTDQPTVTTSVRWGDEYKRIVRYEGDLNAPIGVVRIEEMIDQLVADVAD